MIRFLALVIALLATASLARASERESGSSAYERVKAGFEAATAPYDLANEPNGTGRIGRCFYSNEQKTAIASYFLAFDTTPLEGPIRGEAGRKITFALKKEARADFFDDQSFEKLSSENKEGNLPFYTGEPNEKANALLVDIGEKTTILMRQDDSYVYAQGRDYKGRTYLFCYYFKVVR